MTMDVGFGFDAELDYRQERLRADFRRTHGAKRPWWRRRPAAAVVARRTPTLVGAQHGAGAVTDSTAEVAPVAVESLVVRSRAGAAGSIDDRSHAA